MMEIKSVIYNQKQSKSPVFSFITYLRDCFFFWYPFSKIPFFIRRLFFNRIDYIFFIHPRRTEDYYLGLPFFALLRKYLSKKTVLSIASKMPPVIVSSIKGKKKRGIVLSSLILPEMLLSDKRRALKAAYRAAKFAERISDGKKCFLGLGAWWPIVTRRGLSLDKVLSDKSLVVTNGHTGTLLSINLMIDKIAKIGGIDLKDLKIAVIGAGKMGGNVAKVLNGKVDVIGLVDVNSKNIDKVYENLSGTNGSTIMKMPRSENTSLLEMLNKFHVAVCVTSNARIVLKQNEIPDNLIIIDDSRPEAISRNDHDNRFLVLEGGLMKIKDAVTDYDYGFGVDQNVFGCLAETYALSLDRQGVLTPTLGDVEMGNFERMKVFCENNEIEVGDFKTGNKIISDDIVASFMSKRDNIIESSTGKIYANK